MKLDRFKLVNETPEHFELHDGEASFRVAKAHLHHATVERIKKHFADGGEVDKPDGGFESPDRVVIPGGEIVPVTKSITEEPADYGGMGAEDRYKAEDARNAAANKEFLHPDPRTLGTRILDAVQMPEEVARRHAAESPPVISEVPETAPAPIAQPAPAAKEPSPDAAYQKQFRMQEEAARAQASAVTNLGTSIADTINREDAASAAHAEAYARSKQALTSAAEKMRAEYMNPDNQISADKFWASRSTGQKISGAIGLILGGIGAGINGGPNQALQIIDKAIDRDIEAQKANASMRSSAYRMLMEQGHDTDTTFDLLRLQATTRVQAEIEKAKALAMGPQAQASAQAALAAVQGERANLIESVSQRKAMAAFMMGGGADSQTLAKLPPAEQATMMKQRVMVPVRAPVIGPHGQPVLDQHGAPQTASRSEMRFTLATDPASVEKARDAFMGLTEQSRKLADLEAFAAAHPIGAWTPATRTEAEAKVNDFALSFNKQAEGNQRLTQQELELIKDMTGNPKRILDSFFGNTRAHLSVLRHSIDAHREALDSTYLIPRMR